MQPIRRPVRWHVGVFLLPALIVYTAVMILPLIETLRLSLFNTVDGQSTFVGLGNFKVLFGGGQRMPKGKFGARPRY